jgi:hypothetical protein
MRTQTTRQATYRANRLENGDVRLVAWISREAAENLDRIARDSRRSKRETISIILEKAR